MPIDPDYVDVAERLRQFYDRYPDGRITRLDDPRVMEIGDRTFIVYSAVAYRTPDDPRPCVGTAWEPFPGPTSFTRDSELMNAETSAWGRAIVAAGISSKKIASAEEVRNRAGEAQPGNGKSASPGPKGITEPQKKRLAKALRDSGTTTAAQIRAATKRILGREVSGAELQALTSREASKLIDGLDAGALPDPEHPSDIPDEQESFEVPTAAVGTDPDGQAF